MTEPSPLFAARGARVLIGPGYVGFLRAALRRARDRVWFTQFVVDARPSYDKDGVVRDLLHALAEASSRGVDVRGLFSNVTAEDGILANFTASSFLAARGVAVRMSAERQAHDAAPAFHTVYGAMSKSALHAKLVLVDDDLALVGNHNWTPGALGGATPNAELSLAFESKDASLWLDRAFLDLWRRGKPMAPTRGGDHG